MRIRTTFLAVLTLLLTCPSGGSAQASGRIETRTRLVSQFSDLQNEWLNAVKSKDSDVLNRLLSEDFEVWTPDHNGPIPREDWQAQAFAGNLQEFRISDMAVKSPRDGIAVESFRLETSTSKNGKGLTEHFFVVNLWVNEKENWRCTDSYVSPTPAPPVTPATPTGKN